MLTDREQGPVGRAAPLSDRNGAGLSPLGEADGGGLTDVFGLFRQLSPKLSHLHQWRAVLLQVIPVGQLLATLRKFSVLFDHLG